MGENLVIECFTGGLLATNGYAVGARSGGPVVAVDAPRGFAGWLRSRGWSPAALVLTHQHFDHIEDAAEIAGAFGCPVFAFAPYSRALTLEDLFGGFAGMSLEIRPFEVGVLLEDEARAGRPLRVAGLEFDVIHVPGHSPDSICLFARGDRQLFGGDVLMSGGIGRSDFPGGDGALLVRGIRERLLPLGDDVVVWPGHGPETTIGWERGSNPFL